MRLVFKIIIILGLFMITGCGIKGLPLSPSEIKSSDTTKSLFPFNQASNETNNPDNQTQRPYIPISELEQIGYDYNANFGIENDNLEDVFERIKPKSALIKKRAVIPLANHQNK